MWMVQEQAREQEEERKRQEIEMSKDYERVMSLQQQLKESPGLSAIKKKSNKKLRKQTTTLIRRRRKQRGRVHKIRHRKRGYRKW